jgi:alanine racemase
MSRPIRATFDLSALKHNLGIARQFAGAARVLAVIKANGYGHGVRRVAAALAGADGFAMLELDDAVRLREAGHRHPILLLEGFFSGAELEPILQNRLSVVLHDAEQLAMLRGLDGSRKLDVFVKFNTGMNRLGFPAAQAAQVLDSVRSLPCIGDVVLASHFSDAEGVSGIEHQMRVFERQVARAGFKRSLANSGALLRFPEARGDFVRPGIMLYGASPLEERSAVRLGLQPVMTLASRIIAVQHLKKGDTVGYGSLFMADKPMRIGVVACGYADGYPRHAWNGTPVLVDGVRVPMAGRVSMDMLSVDLTDVPQAGVGSPVTLWGRGLPVEEVAGAAGTVSYELLCALARRVPVEETGGQG